MWRLTETVTFLTTFINSSKKKYSKTDTEWLWKENEMLYYNLYNENTLLFISLGSVIYLLTFFKDIFFLARM